MEVTIMSKNCLVNAIFALLFVGESFYTCDVAAIPLKMKMAGRAVVESLKDSP
jgi:hypothetical protein